MFCVDRNEKVNVVRLPVEFQEFGLEILANLPEHVLQERQGGVIQAALPIFGDEHQMRFQIKNTVPAFTNVHLTPRMPNLVCVQETRLATRTLKVRIRDKHAKVLCRMARGVNYVWNYANAYARHEWKAKRQFVRYAGPGGFAAQTAGVAKELGLLADTVQKVCAQLDLSKRQHKKAWLHFRGKKSLGWIPFKGVTLTLEDGGFTFMKRRFQVWDSYGLGRFEAKDGNLVQDARGHWFLCVPVEMDGLELPEAPDAVGIDLGLKDAAVASDGQMLKAKWYHGIQEKLAVAQRAHRKRRVKALHAKAKNQRQDALHKFSTALVKHYGAIFVGDVCTDFLIKFSPKSTLDAGHGILKAQFRYKSQQASRTFAEVSEKWTTQTCSECGSIAGPKGRAGLNEREWVCPNCGAFHDRDVNAARNIRNLGLGHEPPAGGIPQL